MALIAGYETDIRISESSTTIVYRGHCVRDGQRVILKMLKHDQATASQVTRFRQEYEILRSLDLADVVHALSLEKYRGAPVLILEDCGGDSIKSILTERALTLDEFFFCARHAVRAISSIHDRDIIHKDINPGNMVYHAEAQRFRLIDFGIATRLKRSEHGLSHPSAIEGTLAYISPEQTGRMNCSMDYRTDFYSLGATFYHMLTRRIPFDYLDPLTLIHAHLVIDPVPPHEINPDVPPTLSRLILKLMAKRPDDRYRGALGILSDLEEIERVLSHDQVNDAFELGNNDVSARFEIPGKLYGREQEMERLMAAFHHAVAGRTGMVLVGGFSGIGKTALVKELYTPMTLKKAYFVSGKYGQLKSNIPCSAITMAFRDLARQVLTESEEQLQRWKEKLLDALGRNGQLIIDVIPEVQHIIGPQPPVQDLGPTESLNRFNLVLLKFVRVFCQQDHPLVLFLDDLQWVDAASLSLIKLMMNDEQAGHLLVILAYRDNEVSPAHPFIITIEELARSEVLQEKIILGPLEPGHVSQMLSEALVCPKASVTTLTELIYTKTGGNPFFVNQFLQTLYQEKLIGFSVEERRWQWNAAEIEAKGFSDNVVTLMINKLRKLAPDTQNVLRLASCVGNYFDLTTLSIIQETNASEAYNYLLPAIQEGLIQPLSKLETADDSDASLVIHRFKFLHDRVQQAAYSLIEASGAAEIHLRIGRLLLEHLDEESRDERLFELVDHLNEGYPLIAKAGECFILAGLNLTAGQRALAANAFEASREYLKSGLIALPSGSEMEDVADLKFKLLYELAWAEYLNSNFQASQQQVANALTVAPTPLDQADTIMLLIIQHTLHGEFTTAIQQGRRALGLLGIVLPEADLLNEIETMMVQVNRLLEGREILALVNEPEIKDPAIRLAVQILNELMIPSYLSNQDLYHVVIALESSLFLQYGNVPAAAYGYANLGNLLISRRSYREGYAFGMLGLSLSERFNDGEQRCRVSQILSNNIRHWQKHVAGGGDLVREGYKAGLETGALQFAGYNLVGLALVLYFEGINLNDILDELLSLLGFCEETQNNLAIFSLQAYMTIARNLTGREDAAILDEPSFLASEQSEFTLGLYHIHKAGEHLIYHRPTEALKELGKAEPNIHLLADTVAVVNFRFYKTLALIGVALRTKDKKVRDPALLDEHRALLRSWSDLCPENFLHRYLLVEAELAWLEDDHTSAMDLYEGATAAAEQYGFTQDAALANERAGLYWLDQRREKFARVYLNDAARLYRAWGAKTKLTTMERQFPTLSSTSNKVSITTNTDGNLAEGLDLASVLKAARAISGEIVLSELLHKIMEVLIENAGAERGLFLREHKGEWRAEAEANISEGQITVKALNGAYERDDNLAIKVVLYVARTREPLVLRDASQDERFAFDPYIVAHGARSLACIPILKQGEPAGLIYLENNRRADVFTSDRLAVLKMLSAQIAISVENAALYGRLEQYNRNLEKRVEERTRELAEKNNELAARNGELETLDEVVKAINREVEIKALMESMMKQGLVLLPHADTGEALILDYNLYMLTARTGYQTTRNRFNNDDLHTHFFARATVLEPDILLIPEPDPNDFRDPAPEAVLVMKLTLNDRVYGVLAWGSRNRHAFAQIDAQKLARFHRHAIASMVKARFLRELKSKNDNIIHSIQYAQRIQAAVLPSLELIHRAIPESFILFHPRDIVSGDFYWFHEDEYHRFLAVVDSTGHGVPGAFMSMIGHMLLNRIVVEHRERDPALILERLHLGVREALKQDNRANAHDGMDVCLIRFSKEERKLVFAGAGRPLFHVRADRDEEPLTTIKGYRRGIGGIQREKRRTFTNHDIAILPGDMLYLTTDGYADQCNPERRRFGTRNLRTLLTEIATNPVDEQHRLMEEALSHFRNGEDQRDDITIIGIRILN